MSTHKKRTLSGVVVNNDNPVVSDKSIVLPATSMSFVDKNKTNRSEAVRGTEFLVDPADCRPWKFHNRNDVWMNADKCSDLISSIRKNGQKVPVFARKLENDPDGKLWEIIAGRRRWFACNYLEKKIRVKATDADDRECAILMSLENKDRNNISDIEDAISYKQQLQAKLFDSQDEMSIALDLKKSKLSKLLTASNIVQYNEVMCLFNDITTLKINPVYALVLLLEKNKTNKEAILCKAKELKDVLSKRKTEVRSSFIIKELIECVEKKKKNKVEIKDYKVDDKIVLKVNRKRNKGFVFEFNELNIYKSRKEDVKKVMLEALDEAMNEC